MAIVVSVMMCVAADEVMTLVSSQRRCKLAVSLVWHFECVT